MMFSDGLMLFWATGLGLLGGFVAIKIMEDRQPGYRKRSPAPLLLGRAHIDLTDEQASRLMLSMFRNRRYADEVARWIDANLSCHPRIELINRGKGFPSRLVDLFYRLHFSNEEDAFAFTLKWL